MDTPYSVTVVEEVASTQDLAREKAASDTPAVVIAHRQTEGRGRSGARWDTAPRGLAVSVAFRSTEGSGSVLPLLAGVAARRVLGESVSLKWPNDVLIGDDKVGGILVEATADEVVAGMGLNLYWPEPPPGATSLYQEDPDPDHGPDLGRAWANELLTLTRAPRWPRAEYVAACSTLGRDVSWEPAGSGRAIDIAADGSLMVVDADGVERRLSSGAVSHVRTVEKLS